MAKQIVRVELSDSSKRHHEYIAWVTWKDDAGGALVREPRQDVARRIENGERHYYTKGGGYVADVESYRRDGVLFIRTKGDKSKEDNLLSLVK
jgi:hypothetical protein